MLLSIQDLKVSFRMGEGRRADAVRGVSFDVPENATVALVGESGSGKSVTAMSVLNLLPDNAERSGRILWHRGPQERDLLHAGTAELQALRGKEIACVFQDPMSSLNPVFTVGQQLIEPLVKHMRLSRRAAWERAEALLNEVGIPEAKRRMGAYPHELSGGQQQRVMIAMALACEPKLLIADEPTTALDVTIQRQILELLDGLQKSRRMSMLFISHDLALVGEIADQVVVMRHGVVREQGPVARIFEAPRDDYTRALLACRPGLAGNPARLMVIDDHIAGRTTRHAAKAKDPDAPVLLQVQSLAKSFWLRDGVVREARVQGRARRQLQPAPRPHPGRRRRVGIGQDDDGAHAAAPARAHPRPGAVRRPRSSGHDQPRSPGDAAADPDRVPEPVRESEPALHHRPDAARADDHPRHRLQRRRPRGACPQPARQGRPRRHGVAEVPARVLRRPAAAGRDRPLPHPLARGAGARRGGERARRLGAGAGAQPAEGPAGRARPGLHLHQPRPRGGALHGRRGASS
jgi:ABC-type dipeptide/oligopeptide/nickel transport system ATPase component